MKYSDCVATENFGMLDPGQQFYLYLQSLILDSINIYIL